MVNCFHSACRDVLWGGFGDRRCDKIVTFGEGAQEKRYTGENMGS